MSYPSPPTHSARYIRAPADDLSSLYERVTAISPSPPSSISRPIVVATSASPIRVVVSGIMVAATACWLVFLIPLVI